MLLSISKQASKLRIQLNFLSQTSKSSFAWDIHFLVFHYFRNATLIILNNLFANLSVNLLHCLDIQLILSLIGCFILHNLSFFCSQLFPFPNSSSDLSATRCVQLLIAHKATVQICNITRLPKPVCLHALGCSKIT